MSDLILRDAVVTGDACREVFPTKEMLPPDELEALFQAARELNATADMLMRGIVSYQFPPRYCRPLSSYFRRAPWRGAW